MFFNPVLGTLNIKPIMQNRIKPILTCVVIYTLFVDKTSCIGYISIQHIDAEIKLTTFPRRHCQMHFLELHEFRLELQRSFFPEGPINSIPALFQIIAWRRPGENPLLLMHICVTQPQWVNSVALLMPCDWVNIPIDIVTTVLNTVINPECCRVTMRDIKSY